MKRIALIALLLAPMVAYAGTITKVCTFDRTASPDGLKKSDPFVLTFVTDTETKKTYVVGNNGSEAVRVQPQGQGLGVSFIELTMTGNLMVTTVDDYGTAVTSRNVIMAGKLFPSQMYGKCVNK
jgi:hypothetical protein